MRAKKIDPLLFILASILILSGFFIFMSASLGLFSRVNSGSSFIILKQFSILLTALSLSMIVFKKLPYKKLAPYGLTIFIGTLILTGLVFIPALSFRSGGASRWLYLGFFSFQPSEFLKFGIILFLASWYQNKRHDVEDFTTGFAPFILVLIGSGIVMLKQPDTGTYLVMAGAATAVFVAAGGRWLHLSILFLCGIISLFILIQIRPYVKERIQTFFDPAYDTLGSSYQLRQSLIAVGSGGITGRGFGQSVQKFNYLPEPVGDSIFAVFSEDFGFLGAAALLMLYMAFGLRGLKLSAGMPDSFGRLLGIGIVMLIMTQSLIHITSMIGVLPLTGVPLVFASHGGTSLFVILCEIGLLLQITSKQSTI